MCVFKGCTNRPEHRLDAHRGLRPDGAMTTKKWIKSGGTARMVILIGPLVDLTGEWDSKQLALSFERAYKNTGPYGGITKRCLALYKMLTHPSGRIGRKVVLANCSQYMTVRVKYSRRAFLVACKTKKRSNPLLPSNEVCTFEFESKALPD